MTGRKMTSGRTTQTALDSIAVAPGGCLLVQCWWCEVWQEAAAYSPSRLRALPFAQCRACERDHRRQSPSKPPSVPSEPFSTPNPPDPLPSPEN